MAPKSVRTPNIIGLIAAGVALLLLAVLGAEIAAANANHYRVPFVMRSESAIRDAVLGISLLVVVLRKRPFAGPVAVLVATLLGFAFVFSITIDAWAFHRLAVSWIDLSHLAVAAILVWSVVLPWNATANRQMFIWMGGTFATLTDFVGSLAILARL